MNLVANLYWPHRALFGPLAMADREHTMHACSPEKREIVDARSFFF
jgi:hypothetical protein